MSAESDESDEREEVPEMPELTISPDEIAEALRRHVASFSPSLQQER